MKSLIPSTDTVAKNYLLLQFQEIQPLFWPQRTPDMYMVHERPPNFLIIFLKKRKLISTQLPIDSNPYILLNPSVSHQYLAPSQFSFPHPLLATICTVHMWLSAGLFLLRSTPFHWLLCSFFTTQQCC